MKNPSIDSGNGGVYLLCGSRHGLTRAQQAAFWRSVEIAGPLSAWHCGGCIGADGWIAELIDLGYESHIHWGPRPDLRSGRIDRSRLDKHWVHERAPSDSLVRNLRMLSICTRVLAYPDQGSRMAWHVINNARRYGCDVRIVHPSGHSTWRMRDT